MSRGTSRSAAGVDQRCRGQARLLWVWPPLPGAHPAAESVRTCVKSLREGKKVVSAGYSCLDGRSQRPSSRLVSLFWFAREGKTRTYTESYLLRSCHPSHSHGELQLQLQNQDAAREPTEFPGTQTNKRVAPRARERKDDEFIVGNK